VLENFQFLGGPREGGAPAGGPGGDDAGVDQTAERHVPPPRAASGAKPAAQPPGDEDVPF
jgi:hypothetical protein